MNTAAELYYELQNIDIEKDIKTEKSFRIKDFNYSTMFSTLIKEAAKCNHYASDVFYDLNYIYNIFENFDPERHLNNPIFFGFREMGVDSNNFILSRLNFPNENYLDAIREEYFALYSFTIAQADCFYLIEFCNYKIWE